MAEIKTVLTALPEPVAYWYSTWAGAAFCNTRRGRPDAKKVIDLFDADQMRAYAERAVLEAAPASSAMAMQAGLPYGIVDPDYARIFTIARVLAWSEGYAITMHGSFTRDLDLLAVPWADRVCEPEHLVRRIEDACGLKQTRQPPSEKPHGRLAWTLLFPEFGDPRFVDLSVMQSQQSPVQASDAGRQG